MADKGAGLDRPLANPQALFDDFAYILAVEVEEAVEMFIAQRPSLDEYNAEVLKLYRDIDLIRTRSLNEVAYELVKVEV